MFVDSKGSQCFAISASRCHLVKLQMVVKHDALPVQAMTTNYYCDGAVSGDSPVPLLPHMHQVFSQLPPQESANVFSCLCEKIYPFAVICDAFS